MNYTHVDGLAQPAVLRGIEPVGAAYHCKPLETIALILAGMTASSLSGSQVHAAISAGMDFVRHGLRHRLVEIMMYTLASSPVRGQRRAMRFVATPIALCDVVAPARTPCCNAHVSSPARRVTTDMLADA